MAQTMTVPVHEVYQPAKEGPFLCGHCTHFRPPTRCVQPEIVKLRKGVVEAGGCCDYYKKLPERPMAPLSAMGQQSSYV